MKSSTKYPYFNKKGSIHLMETIHKDGFVCAFEGGDLFKRKHVFKHDEIETSLKFLYSKLVKLVKIKKKFKKFYWLIKYYVPNENQIKDLAKKNQIAQLQITKNRTLWIIAFSVFMLIAVVVFSIDKQKGLKNEKKVLSLKQDALRSQMNPHFMFNALNSIKLYIIKNNQKKATSYLNKFSKFRIIYVRISFGFLLIVLKLLK